MTEEERSELKKLYWLMVEYFERVDIFSEKTELERLALEITNRGIQTISAILGEEI